MKKRSTSIRPPRELLQSGLTHHRAGRLAQAAVCYDHLLRLNPGHADALQFSGVLARQQGRLDVSERLILKAMQLTPSVSPYHHNLART